MIISLVVLTHKSIKTANSKFELIIMSYLISWKDEI